MPEMSFQQVIFRIGPGKFPRRIHQLLIPELAARYDQFIAQNVLSEHIGNIERRLDL